MTKPSEITLQQFNDLKTEAEEVILLALDCLEEAVGMPVIGFHLQQRDDESCECEITFGEPFPSVDEKPQKLVLFYDDHSKLDSSIEP
jgi:hypothetical protein